MERQRWVLPQRSSRAGQPRFWPVVARANTRTRMVNAFPTHRQVCPLVVPRALWVAVGRLRELPRSAGMATTRLVRTTPAPARATAASSSGLLTNGHPRSQQEMRKTAIALAAGAAIAASALTAPTANAYPSWCSYKQPIWSAPSKRSFRATLCRWLRR